jgi:hypothetical protein
LPKLFKISLIIFFSSLFLFNFLLAKNTLILYPPNQALLQYNFRGQVARDGNLKINRLPFGIKKERIQVLSPAFLSYHYEYDLKDKDSFLKKKIGEKFYLNKRNSKSTGLELLSFDQDNLIFKRNRDIVVNPEGVLIAPVTSKLALYPRLSIQQKQQKVLKKTATLSLMLESVHSSLSYKAFFDRKKRELKISSYVLVENKTGLDLKNMALKIKIADQPEPGRKSRVFLASSQPGITQSGISYLYSLEGNYHINKSGLTVFPIFQDEILAAQLVHKLDLKRGSYQQPEQEHRLDVYLKIKNTLKRPLAKGNISIYDQASFITQTELPAVSQEQEVYLFYDTSFDLTGKKVKIESQGAKPRRGETFKITLTNYKDEYTLAQVTDYINSSNWEINSSNYKYQQISANQIKFEVMVPAQKSISIIYKVVSK